MLCILNCLAHGKVGPNDNTTPGFWVCFGAKWREAGLAFD
jgi:hypothetical protein